MWQELMEESREAGKSETVHLFSSFRLLVTSTEELDSEKIYSLLGE